jgi:hypothetical protein
MHPPLWQQALSYPAQEDRASLLGALWPSGGASGGAVTTVANQMQVSVAPGEAAVPLASGQGSALCRWDAAAVVTLAAATHPAGQTRVDLIVVQYRDAGFDGGADNDAIITSVAGTPAVLGVGVETPDAEAPEADTRPSYGGDDDERPPLVELLAGVAPATPANALVLAQVTVPGAVANLNTATVLDNRITSGPLYLPQVAGRCNLAGNQGMPNNWAQYSYASANQMRGGIAPNAGGLRIPISGVYALTNHMRTSNGMGSGGAIIAGIYVNGAKTREGGVAWSYGAPSVGHTAIYVDEYPLNAGDLIQPGGYFNGGGGVTPTLGAGNCWLTASLVALNP